jgi:hypothetical protein
MRSEIGVPSDLGSRANFTAVVKVAATEIAVELREVDVAAVATLEARLDCFLKPRAGELLDYVCGYFGSPMPDRIHTSVSGASHLVAPEDWHNYWLDGDTNGRHLVECVLVQIAQQTCRHEGDYHDWHRVACGAIAAVVDPNFICALRVLW